METKINNGKDFVSFMQWQIQEKAACNKTKTSANYRSALCSFTRFLRDKGRDEQITFEQITDELLESYESYLLHERGITRNTSSFYLRALHTVYKRGADDLGLDTDDPFTGVYRGVDKTAKRAVTPDVIVRLIQLKDTDPKTEFYRDLFVFSFYARGIAFIDLANLKKDNLVNGRLVYRRSKTGSLLSVKVEKVMRDIIHKYDSPESNHLFPILKDDTPTAYWNALRAYNYHLKRLAAKIGTDVMLTSYVPRHSWASEAARLHVPTRVISESMGHSSERTTSIYLTTLDYHEIDTATKKIIDTINRKMKPRKQERNNRAGNITFFYTTTSPSFYYATSTQEVDKFDANVDIILKPTK